MIGDFVRYIIEFYPLIALLLAVFLLVLEGGEAPFFFMLYIAHEIKMPLLFAVVISALCMFAGDLIYYALGPKLERWKWFLWFERHSRRPIQMVVKHPIFTLPVIRFAYGLWHPIMVQLRSGGLPFKRFVEASMVATTIWVLVLTALYILVLPTGLHYVQHFELAVAGIIVGVLCLSVLFRLVLHRHLRIMNGNGNGHTPPPFV